MKRQIAKGLAMVMVTLALAAASAAVANGQSKPHLVANVPFEFVVGDKTFGAGEYQVGTIGQLGESIAIRNAAGDNAIRLSSARERRDSDTAAKLVFHRYGSTYFLSQVWMAGEMSGRELSRTGQERSLQRELKTIVSTKHTYEVVEIAAIVR
jgi:hypothetical protein